MKSANTTVTTTATLLVAADNQNRTIYIHPNAVVYVGNSSVTNVTGFHLLADTPIQITLPLGENLYGITATGTATVLTLTPDGD
jgi:hypothetical protein